MEMFLTGAIPQQLIDALQTATDENTGAVASFLGRVRADRSDLEQVTAIRFEAHEDIATQIVREIVQEAIGQFGIQNAIVRHSLGRVNTGEICFAVVVQGAHRKSCFAALPYIVDSVKSRCPIFGKEIFSEGSERWKTNTP